MTLTVANPREAGEGAEQREKTIGSSSGQVSSTP